MDKGFAHNDWLCVMIMNALNHAKSIFVQEYWCIGDASQLVGFFGHLGSRSFELDRAFKVIAN